jgi:hypothetical protein
MLSRIFPKQFDNEYRGYWLAVWIFLLVILQRVAHGLQSIIIARQTLIGADGIPVDKYTNGGAETVIAIYAVLGIYLLALPLLGLIALIRYRSMIPLMYLLFIALQIGARVSNALHPIARPDGPSLGFTINLIIFVLMLIGFALSLQDRASARVEAPA